MMTETTVVSINLRDERAINIMLQKDCWKAKIAKGRALFHCILYLMDLSAVKEERAFDCTNFPCLCFMLGY